MLQYKIPQNVGIEDKIVGPFSLRQLIILAIGGGISYTLFAITARIYELNVLEYILIALPAIFSLMAAMVKIHNVSFTKYVFLTLEMAIKPKRRMWDHRGIAALVQPDLSEKKAATTQKSESVIEEKKNVNLRDLSSLLDSGGVKIEAVTHEDIDEAEDDDLITEAYFGHKKKESSTENMYWRTRDMQKKKLDILAKMPKVTPIKEETVPVVQAALAPEAPEPPKPPETTTPSTQKEGSVVDANQTPTPAKQESVVDNLAKVIQEARKNNQKKSQAKEAPATIEIPATKDAMEKPISPKQNNIPSTPGPVEKAAEAPIEQTKKKRRRKRKPKPQEAPVRPDTQIDNTQRKQPAKLIKKGPKDDGETSIDDLKQGGEIEFNLH